MAALVFAHQVGRGKGGYPEIPRHVPAAEAKAEGDGSGNLEPESALKETGNANQETTVYQKYAK